MHIGDRVVHPTFGFGRVLELNDETVLVEWETHRVSREKERIERPPLGTNQSHVNATTVSVISAASGG